MFEMRGRRHLTITGTHKPTASTWKHPARRVESLKREHRNEHEESWVRSLLGSESAVAVLWRETVYHDVADVKMF